MTTIVQQNNIQASFNNTASRGLSTSIRPTVLNRATSNGPTSERSPTYIEEPSKAAAPQITLTNTINSESESASITSYDGSESPRSQVNHANQASVEINLEAESSKNISPKAKTQRRNKHVPKDGAIRIEEVQGLGGRDHYLSKGQMRFKVLEAKFDDKKVKLDNKHKPYFKFRLGLNTKKTKSGTVAGNKLVWDEDVKVNYTNQDSVLIKVKGKGRLVDSTIARVRIAIIDVVMKEKKTETVYFMKGDDLVGTIKLEMEFEPRKN